MDSSLHSTSTRKIPLTDDLIETIAYEIHDHLRQGIVGSPSSVRTSKGFPLIPVGVSNRHVHITMVTFYHLFGEKAELEVMRPLYQPGEFATNQVLTIVGTKLQPITNVRILGPFRAYDQVEVSLTDAIHLGIDPPITNSGSLENAAPLTLVGPRGSVYLQKCAIIPNRHIHMSNEEANRLGVKNGDYCKVRIGGEKSLIFENVLIRTNDSWRLQMHLDTDDANAAHITQETYAEFLELM